MKKYLTILSGHPRGGEKTWNSLYRNVIEPLNSDLAVLTGNKWVSNQSFVKKSKYKWFFDEPDDWFSYYEERYHGNWKEYFELGKNTGLYNSGSIHFALKDILLNNYLNEIKAYEQIIFTRFDQFYINKHPDLNNKFIWIPEGEDYFGICDRHAVVPSEHIKKYLDIVDYINSEKSIETKDELLNCEVTYKNQLIQNELLSIVKRFKRSQFTVSIKGDKNNWRIPKYKIYLFGGIFLKYPDEFLDSINNLRKHEKLRLFLSKNLQIVSYYFYLLLRKKLGTFKKTTFKK